MKRIGLIRLGGLAAMAGGVVYSVLGVMAGFRAPLLHVLLGIGAMSAIAALHALQGRRYGLSGVVASVTTFIGMAMMIVGALVGAVLGASLGAAFWDWRTILALAVAGAAGFGVGLLAGDLLRASFPVIRGVGETGSIAVAGSVGGASLGAALGYLEKHRPSGEPRAT
jgi:hypothetical protein